MNTPQQQQVKAPATFRELLRNIHSVISAPNPGAAPRVSVYDPAMLLNSASLLRAIDVSSIYAPELGDETPVYALLEVARRLSMRGNQRLATDVVLLALNIQFAAWYMVRYTPHPVACEPMSMGASGYVDGVDASIDSNIDMVLVSACEAGEEATGWSIAPLFSKKREPLLITPLVGVTSCQACKPLKTSFTDDDMEMLRMAQLFEDDVLRTFGFSAPPLVGQNVKTSSQVEALVDLLLSSPSLDLLDILFTVYPSIQSSTSALFRPIFNLSKPYSVTLLDGDELDQRLRGTKILVLYDRVSAMAFAVEESIGDPFNILVVYPLPAEMYPEWIEASARHTTIIERRQNE